MPKCYKEGILEATQKFKDMLDEIGVEEMWHVITISFPREIFKVLLSEIASFSEKSF